MKEPVRIVVPLDDNMVKESFADNSLLYVLHHRLLGIWPPDVRNAPTTDVKTDGVSGTVFLANPTYYLQQSKTFVDFKFKP